MISSHPCLRRPTTSVLVGVALVAGAILLLGDRFDPAGGAALSQPVHVEAHIVACVADESMRLINPERERCRPNERALASERSVPPSWSGTVGSGAPGTPPGSGGGPGATGLLSLGALSGSGPTGPPGPPGAAGREGADGVSGFEIVTAKLAVATRASAGGEAHCPAGKVALGGGVLPDPDSTSRAGAEDRMSVVVSAPLLPGGGGGGYGWTATVRNTSGSAPLAVVVAAICVTLR